MPDTSAGVSWLAVSTPSVSTSTARCRLARSRDRLRRRAIASYSDVCPHGLPLEADAA